MTDISIIIVSWNTKDILRDCLKSVYRETKRLKFEVIVVDNDSSDGTKEMLKKEFPKVETIFNKENKGFAAANNQGIKKAKGRYVLLLNSDTLILNNAVFKCFKFMKDNPDLGALGCKILNKDGTLQRSAFMYPSILNMLISVFYLNKLFSKSKFFGRERMTYFDFDNIKEVECVMGSFMMIRKRAIKQAGMMDERYFMYTEEADLCYRYKKKGWKIGYYPRAEIIHLGGESSKRIKPKMCLQLRGSILLFMEKNRSFFSYIIACFLTGLWFLLRVPYWLGVAILFRSKNKDNFLEAKTYIKGWKYSWTSPRKLLVR